MDVSEIVWELKKKPLERTLASGKRADARAFDQYRTLVLEPGYVPKAEGSWLARLGDTQVLAGIKLSIGTPYPDTPDKGNISVSAELGPLANPAFEVGPPREESIELARVVDRGIRESKMLDLAALCITPKEKVWTVNIDLHMLDDNGNLLDCASLAAVKALLNTRFPKYDETENKIIYNEKTDKALPVAEKPVSSTFAKIGNSIILDPVLAEEKVLDTRLTIVTTENEICAMQKSGNGTITKRELDSMIEIAFNKAKEIRKQL